MDNYSYATQKVFVDPIHKYLKHIYLTWNSLLGSWKTSVTPEAPGDFPEKTFLIESQITTHLLSFRKAFRFPYFLAQRSNGHIDVSLVPNSCGLWSVIWWCRVLVNRKHVSIRAIDSFMEMESEDSPVICRVRQDAIYVYAMIFWGNMKGDFKKVNGTGTFTILTVFKKRRVVLLCHCMCIFLSVYHQRESVTFQTTSFLASFTDSLLMIRSARHKICHMLYKSGKQIYK